MTAASQASGRAAPAVLILADDLSGAADCGIACVEMGLATTVALRPGLAGPHTDVLAIDTDTRAMTAALGFFESCTPGYYNNEGKGQGGLSSGVYAAGINSFNRVLVDWREKGDLEGIEFDRYGS